MNLLNISKIQNLSNLCEAIFMLLFVAKCFFQFAHCYNFVINIFNIPKIFLKRVISPSFLIIMQKCFFAWTRVYICWFFNISFMCFYSSGACGFFFFALSDSKCDKIFFQRFLCLFLISLLAMTLLRIYSVPLSMVFLKIHLLCQIFLSYN